MIPLKLMPRIVDVQPEVPCERALQAEERADHADVLHAPDAIEVTRRLAGHEAIQHGQGHRRNHSAALDGSVLEPDAADGVVLNIH